MTVRLVVELREDGKVYVHGPLDQKDLCISMLEEAKSAVKNYKKVTIKIPTNEEIKKLNGTSGI